MFDPAHAGVDEPLNALEQAGYSDLYAYRFDWMTRRAHSLPTSRPSVPMVQISPLLPETTSLVRSSTFTRKQIPEADAAHYYEYWADLPELQYPTVRCL